MNDVASGEPDLSDGPPNQYVGTLMGNEIVCAGGDTTLREVAVTMRESEIGLVVVGTVEDVQGVVSERDIVTAVAKGENLDSVTIGAVAGTNLKWATPNSNIGDVIEQMMEGYVRHILVGGDDGRLVGIVSMRDLVAAYPG